MEKKVDFLNGTTLELCCDFAWNVDAKCEQGIRVHAN